MEGEKEAAAPPAAPTPLATASLSGPDGDLATPLGNFSCGNYGPRVEHPTDCEWTRAALVSNHWRGVYKYRTLMGRDRVLDYYHTNES